MPDRHFLPLPFFVCALGVVFSLWNLFGNSEVLCVTEGCALFQNFSIAGISMWWAGVIGMGLLLILSTFSLLGLGSFVAACGVLLDLLLLTVMLGSAPCLNCLLIGLLLALVYMTLRHANLSQRNPREKVGRLNLLLALWGIFFILNAGVLVADALEPWPLPVNHNYGQTAESAPVRIYFSPSCPACVSLVRDLGADPVQAANIGWFPLAESNRDLLIIAQLETNLSLGQNLVGALNSALNGVYSDDPSQLLHPHMLALQIRLWRNQAHVLRAGSNRLPFVEYHGIPGDLPQTSVSSNQQNAQSGIAPTPTPILPATVGGFCEGEEPCEPVAPEFLPETSAEPEPSLLELMGRDQNLP